jgi:ribonuclease HI
VIKLDIWIDGSGFNGERSRFAVLCQDGTKKVIDMACNQTADEMRYHSLLYALNHVAGEGDTIFTDSVPIVSEGPQLLSGKNVKIEWVSKEENKAGRLLI